MRPWGLAVDLFMKVFVLKVGILFGQKYAKHKRKSVCFCGMSAAGQDTICISAQKPPRSEATLQICRLQPISPHNLQPYSEATLLRSNPANMPSAAPLLPEFALPNCVPPLLPFLFDCFFFKAPNALGAANLQGRLCPCR